MAMKRAREESEDSESDANSVPSLKLTRVDSPEPTLPEPDPDDGNAQSPEATLIQEDLLNILDDSDPVIGPEPAIQGLDSVIKSFEEEILVPPQSPAPAMTSDSGEFSRPDLGFLLEASDDELGLPPSFPSGEEQKVGAVDVEEGEGEGEGGGLRAVGFGEMMGYEFPIPSFESFEFGIGGDSDTNNGGENYNGGGEFVALGGLFEPDISELTWRPESLSAS